MRRDSRIQLDDTTIEGLGQRIDELINERFRRVAQALDKLQDRTLIEPVAVEPPKPFDGQVEFADGVNWSPDGTGDAALYYFSDGEWFRLLDNTHASEPGDGTEDHLEDPHVQYWHKILDPAWASLYWEDYETPKVLAEDDIFTGYTGKGLSDWQLASDPVAGTIIVDNSGEHAQTGVYAISITGYAEGTNNQSYVLSVYADGQPTLARCPIIVPGNATTTSIAWSGIALIDVPATLDIRLEHASIGTLGIYTLNWSAHRISPISGTAGVGINVNEDHPPPAPIPDNWGVPGS